MSSPALSAAGTPSGLHSSHLASQCLRAEADHFKPGGESCYSLHGSATHSPKNSLREAEVHGPSPYYSQLHFLQSYMPKSTSKVTGPWFISATLYLHYSIASKAAHAVQSAPPLRPSVASHLTLRFSSILEPLALSFIHPIE